MKYKHFLVSIEDHIATVQFNRPEKANALHRPAWEEMKNLFEELDQNKDVRVIILGGAGKHFCSGYRPGIADEFSAIESNGLRSPQKRGT
jgi:enoyl-CoA hydratase